MLISQHTAPQQNKGTEVVYRLITDLMDYQLFPSELLASQYHWRWEIENTLAEFKTHLNARKTPIRSKKPKLSCSRNLWVVTGSLGSTFFNLSCF